MLNINQFRDCLIKPVLDDLQIYSKEAEELLVFTCAAESHGGSFIKQIKGPALGIYQMEPNTHNDIWDSYLKFRLSMIQKITLKFDCPVIPRAERLIYDMRYSTMMARIHYLRIKYPLPPFDDIDAIWSYYKDHWNTNQGKAKKDASIKLYHRFVGTKNPDQ